MKKILSKNIVILSVVSFFADIASELLFPITPIFLGSLGYGALFIGSIEGFAEFVAGMSKGYFGQQSDLRRSRAPFVRIGYALSTLSKPLIGISNSPFSILLSRFSDRLGKGMRTNARDAWIADESTLANRAKVFGFHRAMDTAGAAVGPLLALAYLSAFPKNYRGLYLWAFIPGAIGVALTFFAKEKSKNPSHTSVNLPKSPHRIPGLFSFLKFWPHSSRDFKRVSALMLIFYFINSSDALLLLLVAKNLHNDQQVIIAYIIYNLAFALLSYPMGVIADKFGMSKTFSFGLFFFAAAYALMPSANTFGQVIGAYCLYAIFCASTESISKAWLSKLVDPKEKGTALGFFTAAQSTCLLLASLWTGLVWQATRAEIPFTISATVALGLAIAFLFQRDGSQQRVGTYEF